MSEPKIETPRDELDRRIYQILYRETVEDVSGNPYLVARVRRARTLLERLMNGGRVLDDDLIRCAIRDTAERKSWGYNPAAHGGRSYAQYAKMVQSARENGEDPSFYGCDPPFYKDD